MPLTFLCQRCLADHWLSSHRITVQTGAEHTYANIYYNGLQETGRPFVGPFIGWALEQTDANIAVLAERDGQAMPASSIVVSGHATS